MLTLVHLVGIPIDQHVGQPGAQHRPRALRRRLGAGQLWLFVVAPALGAVLAALVYKVIYQPEEVISVKAAVQSLESEQAQRRP